MRERVAIPCPADTDGDGNCAWCSKPGNIHEEMREVPENPDSLSGPILRPTVITDGGPWAHHNMPCSICRTQRAIIDVDTGIFHPCDRCRADGWELQRRRRGTGRIR